MAERLFHSVGIFAEEPYSGNTWAGLLDARLCTGAPMQVQAQDGHFAETTVIFPRESAGSTYIDRRVEQGFEIGRNAILYRGGEMAAGHFVIEVGGQAQPVAEARLR